MGILRGGIAKHHAVKVVSKSQPLKLNSERALTPAVYWQIQLANTVVHEFGGGSGSISGIASMGLWIICERL
jgi:hypothetical protein